MAKFALDAVLDALLEAIANAGDRLFVCSAQPTTYAEASATYMLAQHTMTEGDGNGDYTLGDGAVNGRKLTVTAQATINVTNTGTALFVAICDSVAQTVLAVTTVTSQALTSGNTVSVPAFTLTVADPT